ncbi:MAG: GNAT family N-acetyltransferase [Synechococcales bacterium]|nr:GNAT family N-acetyltransferase [Synechococcales bacterium]
MPPVSNRITLSSATRDDSATLFQLIQSLADYEQLSDAVVGSEAALAEHLFGDRPYIDAIVARIAGQPAGFALFFPNYSLPEARPGFYLEDLFVLPAFRRQGVGRALLIQLAQKAVALDYCRLDWSVLDWNTPAIAFYQQLGAIVSEDHRVCRVVEPDFATLAASVPDAVPLGNWTLRLAQPMDLPAVVALLQQGSTQTGDRPSPDSGQSERGLTERSPHLERLARLAHHLTASPPAMEILCVEQAKEVIGAALFYHNYSTFLTRPGLFVESLGVAPQASPKQVKRALLSHLAQIAGDRHCGRLEWLISIQEQETLASFYQRLGATVLPDWRTCHISKSALQQLACRSR